MTDQERLLDIYITLRGIPEAMESAVFVQPPQMEYWIKTVRQALQLATPPAANESKEGK